MRDLKDLQLELKSKENEIAKLRNLIKDHPSYQEGPRYDEKTDHAIQQATCGEKLIKDNKNTTGSVTKPSASIHESIKVETIYPGQSNSLSPVNGSIVKIHYTIAIERDPDIILEDSRERRKKIGSPPFEFLLGKQQVIPGWETAVKRMNKGEVCRVTISSEGAYGTEGLSPSIPTHANLICRIELIDFYEHKSTVQPPIIETTNHKQRAR